MDNDEHPITTEGKIDKILQNVSYMRGQWDSTIPALTVKVDAHTNDISSLKISQENIKTKVAIAGGFAGLAVATVFNWIASHIKI